SGHLCGLGRQRVGPAGSRRNVRAPGQAVCHESPAISACNPSILPLFLNHGINKCHQVARRPRPAASPDTTACDCQRSFVVKRFQGHPQVDGLSTNLGFHATMFDAEPGRIEADYATWELAGPPINFAISTRGSGTGIDHLGIQTDNPEDLAEMKRRAQAADMSLLDEGETTCCYARSEKHWVTDPQGIAWEA